MFKNYEKYYIYQRYDSESSNLSYPHLSVIVIAATVEIVAIFVKL